MAIEYHNFAEELSRSIATRGAVASLPEIVIKMALAFWDALIGEARSVDQAAQNADSAWRRTSGLTTLKMDALYLKAQAIKGAGEAEFGEDHPEVAAQFTSVLMKGNSWAAILKTCAGILAAWAQVTDADTWEPTEGFHKSDFEAMVAEATALQQQTANALKASRKAAAKLRAMAKKLHTKNTAWYTAATALYPDNTPDGVTVRSVVIASGSGKSDAATLPPV